MKDRATQSLMRTLKVIIEPTLNINRSERYFVVFHLVPRQFVYGHFVYDTSSTDISSTDISSTTVYQRTVGLQLYIQLLFQHIIIFINSNFYLHYDSFYQSNFTSTDTVIVQHIQLASIVA